MMQGGVEFFCGDDGRVWFRHGDGSGVLRMEEREMVVGIIDIVRRVFPRAYDRLCEMFGKSHDNRLFFEYRIVDRFVRCNMGRFDCERVDYEDGRLQLERVGCPLRGICGDEHVVCCPEIGAVMSREEWKAARLYSCGFSVAEIAGLLGKSCSTVNNQLWGVSRRLGLRSRRDVIGVCRNYGLI